MILLKLTSKWFITEKIRIVDEASISMLGLEPGKKDY